jgi:choline dehydrogenase-like flavoprotein
MNISDLHHLEDNATLETDLCIVGTGPAGLSIAAEFAGTNTSVLVLESGGLEWETDTQALCDIVSAPPRQMNQDILRARILGGSSHIWTGRCAPFHPLDFETRPWVANSGWPIARSDFEPWLTRAGRLLGLGPNLYDDASLWASFGVPRPAPPLDENLLDPMFWQFSKSPRNVRKSIDFGRDRIANCDSPNIQVLLHANVVQLKTNAAGTRFESAMIRTLNGGRATVRARTLVLCCGGIENARLLLVSGLGNQHDNVGRYLMDHTDSVVGNFDPNRSSGIRSRFGHYWLDNDEGRHVYLHGLALGSAIQKREQLLNCHMYVDSFDAHPDDPWLAVQRCREIVRSQTGLRRLTRDLRIALSQSPDLLRGIWRRRFRHRPHLEKLTRIELHCILEQIPDRESRVTLSPNRKDALGIPLSRIDWKISEAELRTARRMTQIVCQELRRLGLPAPTLSPSLDDLTSWKSNCVEKAHPTGTTRMSDNPREGVVDRNCQIHGIDGLFVAGSSVFPTAGAANPTLMIVASSLRTADWIKHSRAGRDSIVAGIKPSEVANRTSINEPTAVA